MNYTTARLYIGDMTQTNRDRMTAGIAGSTHDDHAINGAARRLVGATGSVKYHARTTAGSYEPADIATVRRALEYADDAATEYRAAVINYTASQLADAHGGATVTDGTGHWQGTTERATIIECLMPDTRDNRAKVDSIAHDVRRLLAQDAVLVTFTPCESNLVTG